ncbi:MAG: PAS domain-containing sensor histidine kinase [Promethearchaeota archaeon]|jgi:PAS domain S-box-containing protein
MKYSREEVREKYKDLFDYSLDLIYVNDFRGNFLDANNIALEKLEYKRKEIPNISFIDLLDEENLFKAIKVTNEIKKNGKQSERSEYKLKTKTGKFIYVETYAIPLKKNNKIYAILGIGNDITERKLGEQKLKESEEKYRYLFENSPFSIILINANGEIIDCNPATVTLGEYEKNDLVGKKFKDLAIIHPDFLPEIIDLFKRFIKGEELHRIDIKLYKKNGDLIWVNLQASLMKLGSETLVHVILNDITKRKEAEFLIKEEIQKLKELEQIRKDLISRVSHELKTPLVSVFSSSELLLEVYKDRLSDEVLELVQLIQKGGTRLNHLVNNLLDITRIEFNKFKLERNLNDLSVIIREISAEMKYLIKQRNLNLSLIIPESCYLKIDRLRIEQVITNLFLNAIKNTPPKGEITLKILNKDDYIELSVKDTGIGLTKEEMDIIFTRFGKIEREGDGLEYIDIQGSGLGLFISKEIVDLHEGTIKAESEGRYKGSEFIVKLPIKE